MIAVLAIGALAALVLDVVNHQSFGLTAVVAACGFAGGATTVRRAWRLHERSHRATEARIIPHLKKR